jgi:hypothetical protein
MLIEEIIVRENPEIEVIAEIQTQLSRAMSQGLDEINTSAFLRLLHKQGYTWVTLDQLVGLVDSSGYASSVSRETIVPGDHLGDDVPQADSYDDEVDVGDMADSEAMSGIGDEL